MNTEKIYTQHEENKEWLNDLLFYKDEIKVMKNRLSEVVSKNTSKDVLADLEHFQNQLILKSDRIDELKHEINLSNDQILEEIKSNMVAVDHRRILDHSNIRQDMKYFKENFESLRKEFNAFLSKWI